MNEPIHIEISTGGAVASRITLQGESMIIGRGVECDIQLDSPRVSRHHAQLRPDGPIWLLRDLQSHNGTTVNGIVIGEQAIAIGDVIGIGQYQLRVLGSAQEPNPMQRTTTATDNEPAITRLSPVLRHDLHKARKMQLSLIPQQPSMPGLEIAIGFEPCNLVAGDHVNVLPTPDNRAFVIVGDVTGKGTAAALVAAGVHSITETAVRGGHGLIRLAAQLNEYLLNSMNMQTFVSMICAMIDPATGSTKYVNAGHPPMFIIRPNGVVVQHGLGQNLQLGTMDVVFEEAELTLQPDELLMLYTDGLYEIRVSNSDLLGLDELGRRVAAIYADHPRQSLDGLRDRISEMINAIQEKQTMHDDRTFLLARRKV